jgi:hypothetical protein
MSIVEFIKRLFHRCRGEIIWKHRCTGTFHSGLFGRNTLDMDGVIIIIQCEICGKKSAWVETPNGWGQYPISLNWALLQMEEFKKHEARDYHCY